MMERLLCEALPLSPESGEPEFATEIFGTSSSPPLPLARAISPVSELLARAQSATKGWTASVSKWLRKRK
jgi:hypothetical protein